MTRKTAVVPPSVITWSLPGDNCTTTKPGDLILVQHRGGSVLSRIPGWGIRFGEWLRPSMRPFAWCDHAMIVETGGPDAIVIQETTKGSVETPLNPSLWNGTTWPGFTDCLYAVVSPQVDDQLKQMAVAFAQWTLGSGYGWWSLPLDAIDDITGLHMAFSWSNRMVCSAAACRAHERLGLIPDRDPAGVRPGNLACYYDISTIQAVEVLAAFKRE